MVMNTFFCLIFCGFFGCFVAIFSLNSYFWYCLEFYGIVYEISYNFYAFSSVLNYLDLHASSTPHSIFLRFLRFLFGSGCLWLNGILGSIAYNWSRLNMKTGVKIIHPSSYYGKVPVTRKGFFFSTLFFLPSIFFNNLSPFFFAGKRFVKPFKVTEDMDIDHVSPFHKPTSNFLSETFPKSKKSFVFILQ